MLATEEVILRNSIPRNIATGIINMWVQAGIPRRLFYVKEKNRDLVDITTKSSNAYEAVQALEVAQNAIRHCQVQTKTKDK